MQEQGPISHGSTYCRIVCFIDHCPLARQALNLMHDITCYSLFVICTILVPAELREGFSYTRSLVLMVLVYTFLCFLILRLLK